MQTIGDDTYTEVHIGVTPEQLQEMLRASAPGERAEVVEVTVPPLPGNLVPRKQALDALRETVLANQGRRRTIAFTALEGMGGIGKTVLAQMVCHDNRIKKRFRDGILWQTIGRESGVKPELRLRAVVKALGKGVPKSEIAAVDQYRRLMRNKAVLIVIDDVWDAKDIQPWLVESAKSRVLFTTRDSSIAAAVGAKDHRAELLALDEAREVLKQWAGLESGELPPEAADLIGECGRLPLALSMVGAMLRGKPRSRWKRTLDLLRSAELKSIGAQFPAPHESLFRTLHLSVERLKPPQRECYEALAVLLEGMPASPEVQRILWGMDAGKAEDTRERFISLSLAQRESDDVSITLHALQLDYVRAQYPDLKALETIHEAVQLSAHVIGKDPSQFAPQIVGRLVGVEGNAGVQDFVLKVREDAIRPWLRPLWPTLDPPGGALLRTLEGHSDWVRGVALSGEGRLAVSASDDNTLKVWEVESGRLLRTLVGHSDVVNGVAVSGDGRRAVSASADQTLKVWDVGSGKLLRTLVGHSNVVRGVAITADARRAVSASDDRTVKVWELETGKLLRTLDGHSDRVAGVAVSADGRLAASASEDHTAKVWEVGSGRVLNTLADHSDVVYSTSVDAEGRIVVSGSADETVKVWDAQSGRLLHTLVGHSDQINGVSVSADGRTVASASADQTLRVWEIETGNLLRTLEGHSAEVAGVALSADGQKAVSASADQTVKVWQTRRGRTFHALNRQASWAKGVAAGASGGRVTTVAAQEVILPEPEAARPLWVTRGHFGRINGLAVSADGRCIVSASADKTLKVWDVEIGREMRPLEGHWESVNGVAVSADGRIAVSASEDWTLKAWDVETGRELATLEGHKGAVYGVAISADARRAISASADRTAKVWDLKSGQVLHNLEGHEGPVTDAAMTADGLRAVSASEDKALRVWDLENGKLLLSLEGHRGPVTGVALRTDGRCAVSASADKTLKVWELGDGRLLSTLEGRSGVLNGVALSAGGKWAASVSDDRAVKVWDLTQPVPLAAFTCEGRALCCAFIGPDHVIAGDAGGRLYSLQLEL